MSKNYWQLKPEELNAEELQKYIFDLFVADLDISYSP